MSLITKFAGRDPGASARMTGFINHLRDHGFVLGVGETQSALSALDYISPCDPQQVLPALKCICASSQEDTKGFEELFNSYWRNEGRIRSKVIKAQKTASAKHTRTSESTEQQRSEKTGRIDSPQNTDNGNSETGSGEGKLIASQVRNLMKTDMRELVSAQDIRKAEETARRLAQAIVDRRSRRRIAARNGALIDFRRVVRKSLSTGGEPIVLPRKKRPDRPVRITALCDVSGSMTAYARVFLAFLAGLLRADDTADAYMFHTRLVRITGALRDDDPLRALNRLTLLADGFGGGSKIGANLLQFSRTYARRFVGARNIVIIFSDGYDSDAPKRVGDALKEIKKRGCKIIWINPMKGWKDYAPIASGMASALPHLDLFAPANTLESLGALEKELAWI